MTESCPPIRELLQLGVPETAPSDPRWRHVNGCPRCRSLLRAYVAFTAPDEPADGNSETAERLRGVLEERIRGTETARSSRRRAGGWLHLLVPAFGAAAILAGAFLLLRDEVPWSPHATVLREQPGVATRGMLATHPPHLLDGGGLELRWRPFPPADSYRVRLLDAGLQELGALAAGADTLLILEPSRIAGPPRPIYFEVEALFEGDPIGTSAPRRLIAAS
jgi:hypothetical protein